jgi:hypothetical protein
LDVLVVFHFGLNLRRFSPEDDFLFNFNVDIVIDLNAGIVSWLGWFCGMGVVLLGKLWID